MDLTDLQMRTLGLLAARGPLGPGHLSLLLWPDERGRRFTMHRKADVLLEGLRRRCLVEWAWTGMHCRLTSLGMGMATLNAWGEAMG